VCHNQVHLAPRDMATQQCEMFRLLIHPAPADRGRRVDYFGNHVDYFSIHEAHRGLTVTANSRVTVKPPPVVVAAESPPWEDVVRDLRRDLSPAGLDAYQYVFDPANSAMGLNLQAAGRTNGWSDGESVSLEKQVLDYVRPSFPSGRPIIEAARDLTNRIHRDFVYDSKATTVYTSVAEVLRLRRGVCQDFALVEIACLRAMGLAARYVSGYLRTFPPPGRPRLIGADASHAWISLYAGPLGWIDFDPTNNVIPMEDHITVAWGRDYNDVCPIQGVFVGGGQHAMSVSVDIAPATAESLSA
jgi:transglutaminase-like putative cysteine protease